MLSWIWFTASGSEVLEDNVNENLCAEWCKACARVHCYWEEIKLIDEEMGHAVAFTKWRGDWWLKQVNLCQNVSAEARDSLKAYGRQQSAIEQEQAQVWEAEWLLVCAQVRGVLVYLDGESEIPTGSRNVELEDDDDEFELFNN
ncbi:hypothetical protein BT96DRAFT_946041 [Gymnopus androsaceus JB14]|uniref:Uncharacterized protein n=1 Tax=Gymnopus androsaceus JB14 TaxID=1447944 RepID=A0A6A4GYK8_9AGAR|nr:hypothetical protein BT96DRAFT_946041 [Gymnopus androsaceus JB14]